MSKRRTSDELYTAARAARDLEAVASGNPRRMLRRIRNRIAGHAIARTVDECVEKCRVVVEATKVVRKELAKSTVPA